VEGRSPSSSEALQLLRKERGAIQKGLNLGDLQNLLIFKPCDNFQQKIENIFKNSFRYIEQSKKTYAQAEEILLSEIGLKDFSPSTEPVMSKIFPPATQFLVA